MKNKKHSVLFCIQVYVMPDIVGFKEGEHLLSKRFEEFPYLPVEGARINLQGAEDFSPGELVVIRNPWLMENDNSFDWIIDLKVSGLLGDRIPEATSVIIESCKESGWKIEQT